jgi:DNA-directed RNA polymerase subunit K/omega
MKLQTSDCRFQIWRLSIVDFRFNWVSYMIDRSKLPNSFEFVVTAGARARQLLAGSTPRVAVGEHKKTTIAQQEVITKAVEKIVKEESGN